MKEVSSISVGETVFKYAEISTEGGWLGNENARFERQLQGGYAKSLGKPLFVILKCAKAVAGVSDMSPT